MEKFFLITLEYPPQKGGVASYYEGLVGELRRQGYEVKVITNARNPSQPPLTLRGGNLLGWIWPKWVKGYFTVRAAIKKEKPDYLFVGHILPLGTIAYLLRKRVPYVVFTHGMDVLLPQKSWRKRRLMNKILGHAKCVVANSEFTKQEVQKIVVGKKPTIVANLPRDRNATIVANLPHVVVVHPCPSIPAEAKVEDVEVLRRKLGLTGKKVLLTLGRVVERKGHDVVLRALPEILQHVPNAVYVIAGTGPYLGKLQEFVARDFMSRKGGTPQSSDVAQRGAALQSAVRFVGAVSDEGRPAYYALCDLFVMPSRQIGTDVEGFGLAFLEAAMFGKASIGGNSGGVPEAILDGKTGALVDPNDASALARIVVQLLRNDGLRTELGQNAKARTIQEFTWDTQIRKLVDLL